MNKGTNRKHVIPAALNPDSFKLDARSEYDLYQEARRFAGFIRYYEDSATESPGSWADFFEERLPLSDGNCKPHLALFLSFIRLYRHTQNQLNALTKKNLEFYYQRFLQEKKLEASADFIYLFFELSSQARKFVLPADTLFSGGLDSKSLPFVFKSARETQLSQARLNLLFTIYNPRQTEPGVYASRHDISGDAKHSNLRNLGTEQAALARIGLAISSPALLLMEGEREIQLTFITSKKHSAAIKDDVFKEIRFTAFLSNAKGWTIKRDVQFSLKESVFHIHIKLDADDAPVVPFIQEIHANNPDFQYTPPSTADHIDLPVLALTMSNYSAPQYQTLAGLQFTSSKIRISAIGIRALTANNDYGNMDIRKAFQPFGFNPAIGSSFYVSADEFQGKKLVQFDLIFKWKGLPKSFKNYYEGYLGQTNSLVNTNEDFKVNVAVRSAGEWITLKAAGSDQISLLSEILSFNPDLQATNVQDTLIRLTLAAPEDAFGHNLYTSVYARAMMALIKDKDPVVPNPPYTPVIESCKINYVAEQNIEQFFHIDPFGTTEVLTSAAPEIESSFSIVSDRLNSSGRLYFGLSDIVPPQIITIFFELEAISPAPVPDFNFLYLSARGWETLDDRQVLSDTTLRFKESGMITFSLPEDLCNQNPQMPLHNYWLSICIEDNAEDFPAILSLRTNGALCQRVIGPGYSAELTNQVKLNAVNRLFKDRFPELKKISQPFVPFGGRALEKDEQYFLRISEKIRHNMRGIDNWDVEHLVLQQVPEVYQVRSFANTNHLGEFEPGSIHILVVPDISGADKKRLLKPTAPFYILERVRNIVAGSGSIQRKVSVSNPLYQVITIEAAISLRGEADAGYYLGRLQDELHAFLSPWAYDDNLDIPLGNRVYLSSVISFIESKPYVAFLAEIKLYKDDVLIAGDKVLTEENAVAVSDLNHRLKAVNVADLTCQTVEGIGQMIVDINFEIN